MVAIFYLSATKAVTGMSVILNEKSTRLQKKQMLTWESVPLHQVFFPAGTFFITINFSLRIDKKGGFRFVWSLMQGNAMAFCLTLCWRNPPLSAKRKNVIFYSDALCVIEKNKLKQYFAKKKRKEKNFYRLKNFKLLYRIAFLWGIKLSCFVFFFEQTSRTRDLVVACVETSMEDISHSSF